MRQLLGSLVLALVILVGASPTAWGAEARLLTLTDIAGMGGTDFDGGEGDYLLRNDTVEAVVLAVDVLPDFGSIPIVAEALPGRGILVDVGTLGDKNDQLSEIDHLVNLDQNIIFYTEDVAAPIFSNFGPTAAITVFGTVIFAGAPGPSGLVAQTTYSVTDGQSWIDIETTLTNFSPVPEFVFSIADADITASRSRLPFQPFPNRGHKPPPLDISNPAASVAVWSYVTLAGNNDPGDGPANNDGSPSEAVSYTFIPDSLFTPLIGFGSDAVTVAGNNDPQLLGQGDSMTFTRKLVVAKGNSVEASLDIALPVLNTPVTGFDLRGTFTGRVVDGASNPVPDAHIFFDNTVPGAPFFVAGFVTFEDENQDGSPDGPPIPAVPGAPLPSTHVVTAADGTFTVKLQAQFGTIPSIYSARVQAPERGTVTVAVPLVVSPANIPDLGGTPTNLGDIVLSNTGTLAFTVNDLGVGTTGPAKLTIVGTDGTDNPDFGSQYLSLRNYSGLSKDGGADGLDPVTEGNSGQLSEVLVGTPALNFHVDADGVGDLELAPGSYVVFASRGLEYTIDAVPVTITAGTTSNGSLGIERVVDTSGFLSMDFHIHSTKSFDSSVPITDRTVSFLAAGVDVMVSTDHDYITDYSPVIASLGVGGEIASIVGNELTGGIPVPADATQGGNQFFPEGIGHWNAWPLSVIPGNRRNGAPQDEFITPGTAVDRLRGMDSLPLLGKTPDTATLAEWLPAIQAGQPGTPGELLPPDEEVVMLNHPRAGFAGTVVIGLFNGLVNPGGAPPGGYDPTKVITDFPNVALLTPSLYSTSVVGPAGTDTNALSFDAVELMNGSGVGSFLRVRDDWCSLLDQGIHKTGTGVSDSHRLILENAGYARSFVASSTDDPAATDEDELTQNVRDMQLTGTTGPFVRFSVQDDGNADVGLGGTAVATGNKVTLKIRVEAAPWIPVEEVRIYRNCELIETRAIQSSKVLGKVLRFNRALPIAGIDADSYLHVEAGVRLDASGDPVSPGLLQTVQTIEPGVVPFSFTNPIFVDRDGGGYTPPGL